MNYKFFLAIFKKKFRDTLEKFRGLARKQYTDMHKVNITSVLNCF